MLHSQNRIVPSFDGELRTDKPPLHYYFMMLAYETFGENEFAARFFSAVMGLLTVLITFVYTKRLVNEFAAFCACLVLVSSTHFLFEFRLAVPDPYLIFFITLGLFSGFKWIQKNAKRQLYIASAALALATLAKGPVAIALPGLCLLIWIIMKRKWKNVFSWHLFGAVALYLIIALPWYIAVHKATNGAWTKGFFIENNLNRFSDPQEGHGGFFLITLVFIMVGLLPFISFVGELLKQRRKVLNNNLIAFSVIVVIVFLIFFSISSTRLPNYAMPCYPFAAAVLGYFISLLLDKKILSKKYPYLLLLVLTTIIPVAGYFAIAQEPAAKQLSWLAMLLFIVPVLFIIMLPLAKNWSDKITAIFFIYTAFNIVGLHFIYPALYKQNPVAKTIDTVKKYSAVYSYNVFNPGYLFYMNKNIPRTYSTDTLRMWLNKNPDALVITRTNFADTLKRLPLTEVAAHHDIFELPTTLILKSNVSAQH